MLFALFLPLPLALILGLQVLMKAAYDSGHKALGPLILLGALGAVAVAGPAFERMRLRVFFGETVLRRRTGRLRNGAVFFFVNLVLTALSFAAAVGWIIVSARNLTYPIWGWESYPTDAWGGPTPAGAVALHFASGVVAFFVLPWVVIHITRWQCAMVRRHLGESV
ncbi:hypothetical protein [Streptomyces sp. XD-27]|uniref:hypothetical protein n=1 Tax=Streptomyces sp. XD-27 TaxID=3062779 RepID=UPI0026F43111|nr:hypothetical protein [Streptomyces sp. XD-27]WKX69492.1 hypothetical protein Q3Y56_05805 [Streptomyces sp. XD-27]